MRALGLAVLILCAAAPAVAQSTEPWVPLVIGSQWVYSGTGQTTTTTLGRRETKRREEQLTVSVIAGPPGDPDVRVLQTQLRTSLSGESPVQELWTDHLRHTAAGLLGFGHGHAPGGLAPVESFAAYDPPHVLLPPSLAPGTRWQASEGSQSGAQDESISIRGEVHEPESVTTPGGRFDACLVVVYRSGGDVDVPGEPGTSARVTRERTEWYARGVGLVKRTLHEERGTTREGVETGFIYDVTLLLENHHLTVATPEPQPTTALPAETAPAATPPAAATAEASPAAAAAPTAAPPAETTPTATPTAAEATLAPAAPQPELGSPARSPVEAMELLREHLSAGDLEGALALIHPDQRRLYRVQYERLAALADEAAVLRSFRLEVVAESRATVTVERRERGSERSRYYEARLAKAADGSWWIVAY